MEMEQPATCTRAEYKANATTVATNDAAIDTDIAFDDSPSAESNEEMKRAPVH